ncbi:DUF2945 domain-containing protein [Micromonospora sp. NPDC050397]|uniref:DUF2945 domain-containing protein n=1 Tax=Micromonospora sp. NPDC050397 TaxID=3364279 RepID=UPI00384AEDC9
MDKDEKLHKGDRVSWRSHGGTAYGTVQEELTQRTTAARRTVDASREEPHYRVRTDSGAEAVHRSEALRRAPR